VPGAVRYKQGTPPAAPRPVSAFTFRAATDCWQPCNNVSAFRCGGLCALQDQCKWMVSLLLRLI